MADVFSNAPQEDDEEATPGLRVAGALTGSGEDTPEEEDTPQAEQPQGVVDDSAHSYLVPAEADEDTSGMRMSATGPISPEAEETDVPVSADTKAYMTPIAPPTLAKPADYADHSADTAAMTAQKVAEAKENVKPSIGRKILAAFAAGATGFGSGSEAGARVGQSVLNAPRANAEARWATQEAPLQAKLNADQAADAATRNANVNTEQSNRLAEQNYGLQERGQQSAARAQDYQAKAAARNEQVNGDGWHPDDPKNPLGGYTATTIGGKTVHSATAPAAVQNTADYRIADAEAKGHPFTMEQQQILRSGGKLTFRPPPNPRQPSEGEISLGQARAAFIKENGRPPETLDEQNQVTQAAKGTLDRNAEEPNTPGTAIASSISDKNKWINKHQLKDDLYGDVDPKTGQKILLHSKGAFLDDNGGEMPEQDVKDQLEGFRTKLNNSYVMRKSGTMVNEKGETVSNRFSRNPQITPQAQPQSPAAAPAPSGMKVSLSQARTLPINKGKSDDQIRADIVAHGHQVAP